jgi:hypothetical protein
VLRCDDCGAEIAAHDRERLVTEAKQHRWTELGPDLCPSCQQRRFNRRFTWADWSST